MPGTRPARYALVALAIGLLGSLIVMSLVGAYVGIGFRPPVPTWALVVLALFFVAPGGMIWQSTMVMPMGQRIWLLAVPAAFLGLIGALFLIDSPLVAAVFLVPAVFCLVAIRRIRSARTRLIPDS